MDYKTAGVDIDKADALVSKIKDMARQTTQAGVIGGIGGFGGLFSLNNYKTENPVLVSSTDGVGTKLKIASLMGKHNTVGIDLVAMVVNDIVVQGAKPLFFLDYFSTGKLDSYIANEVITGIVEGCKQAQCSLLGGETAEMPGMYSEGDYDLAGFAVGIVDNSKIVDGSEIRIGDKIIGIASSGLHSNGFSLVRKICFDMLKMNVWDYIDELGHSLGKELLTPTKIYVEAIDTIIRGIPVSGIAHITGGGLVENILRIIPNTCAIEIAKHSWIAPPIFNFLQAAGKISEKEMLRTFNNGIGMVLIVNKEVEQDVVAKLNNMGESAYQLGQVTKRISAEKRHCFV